MKSDRADEGLLPGHLPVPDDVPLHCGWGGENSRARRVGLYWIAAFYLANEFPPAEAQRILQEMNYRDPRSDARED